MAEGVCEGSRDRENISTGNPVPGDQTGLTLLRSPNDNLDEPNPEQTTSIEGQHEILDTEDRRTRTRTHRFPD